MKTTSRPLAIIITSIVLFILTGFSIKFKKEPLLEKVPFPQETTNIVPVKTSAVNAIWELAAIPTIDTFQDSKGVTTKMFGTFSFHVTARGASIKMPSAISRDVTIVATNANGGNKIICPTTNITVVPDGDIPSDVTVVVSVTAELPVGSVSGSGRYWFSVQQIHWETSDGTLKVDRRSGLESFKTLNALFWNAANP